MFFYYDVAGKNPRPFRQFGMEYPDFLLSFRASLSGTSLESPSVENEYIAVEKSIPEHSIAVENVAYPFLFNFQKRNILIMDWPGAASPKPGWTIGSSADNLAQYFKNNSVRYVVYDYSYARWLDAEACKELENPQRNSQELLVLWNLSVISHGQMDALLSGYQSIYNNGKIAVIDLDAQKPSQISDGAMWNTKTNVNEVCSIVAERYLAGMHSTADHLYGSE